MTDAKTIAAIIPTYNDHATLPPVLDAVLSYEDFAEVLVVDDGETNETKQLVSRYPTVRYIKSSILGKGESMDEGVQATTADIIFFCDADVRGLTADIIEQIIAPVAAGHADMSVAIRGRSVSELTALLGKLFPTTTLIAGERAVTRQTWNALPAVYKHGFEIEIGLNHYVLRHGRLVAKSFPTLRQYIKEQKYGIVRGVVRRFLMIGQVLRAHWLIHTTKI